jgi:hypothetical protein
MSVSVRVRPEVPPLNTCFHEKLSKIKNLFYTLRCTIRHIFLNLFFELLYNGLIHFLGKVAIYAYHTLKGVYSMKQKEVYEFLESI